MRPFYTQVKDECGFHVIQNFKSEASQTNRSITREDMDAFCVQYEEQQMQTIGFVATVGQSQDGRGNFALEVVEIGFQARGFGFENVDANTEEAKQARAHPHLEDGYVVWNESSTISAHYFVLERTTTGWLHLDSLKSKPIQISESKLRQIIGRRSERKLVYRLYPLSRNATANDEISKPLAEQPSEPETSVLCDHEGSVSSNKPNRILTEAGIEPSTPKASRIPLKSKSSAINFTITYQSTGHEEYDDADITFKCSIIDAEAGHESHEHLLDVNGISAPISQEEAKTLLRLRTMLTEIATKGMENVDDKAAKSQAQERETGGGIRGIKKGRKRGKKQSRGSSKRTKPSRTSG